MKPVQSAVLLFLLGGVLLGAGAGSYWGFRIGLQDGLLADTSAREMLAAEVVALQTINKQHQISLQTAEESITQLTRTIEDQQRAHEFDTRELALYRRIESGGLDRGVNVDSLQLLDSENGPVLRITLLQVAARDKVQGKLGVTLIGTDLPGATDGQLVLSGGVDDDALAFDFRFMSRHSVPLPENLQNNANSGETFAWLKTLDMVEIYIIPTVDGRRPKRVTVPAESMIVGPVE